jgi:hypothetical protein
MDWNGSFVAHVQKIFQKLFPLYSFENRFEEKTGEKVPVCLNQS